MHLSDKNMRGFVLPLTLWIIAAMGLISAMMSEWVSEATNNALIIKEKSEANLIFSNIRNELAFIFARRPYTFRGLQVGNFINKPKGDSFNDILNADFTSDQMIKLDGTNYIMSSDRQYVVRIHDGKGLVNLNTVNLKYLKNMFSVLEIPETSHNALADALLDYRDEDDFRRLSGAEENTYIDLGLYPPSNSFLVTPLEAQRILGWTNLKKLWDKHFEKPIITTCKSSGFNPNTASKEALSTFIDGISYDNSDILVSLRKKIPFRNIRDVGDSIGLILNEQPFFFSFLPGRCFIIDLIKLETGEHTRFSLTLLPRNTSQPWQIDYVYKIPNETKKPLLSVNTEETFPSPEDIYRRGG